MFFFFLKKKEESKGEMGYQGVACSQGEAVRAERRGSLRGGSRGLHRTVGYLHRYGAGW